MQRISPEAVDNPRKWRARLEETGWWHSFELPDGRVIQGVNTLETLKNRLALFPIPQDLSGKRVLDIGAWDGWFSLEMERRGAQVVAVDAYDSKNFRYLQRELRSKIDYRIMDVYEMSPARLGGTFDIVLFLGVLYHLKHPLLGLEKVCALTRDLAIVQTFVSPESGSPVMEFFEIDELGGQVDNWCAPNTACVTAMARTAGFARAEVLDVSANAASVACYRRFPAVGKPSAAAPVLAGCSHMTNFGINVRSDLDEYLSAWFTCDAQDLARQDVQAGVGQFHSAPVALAKNGDLWQVNFKVPPGLDPGWSEVRVRTVDSDWSNPGKIAIDMPVEVEFLAITGAADGNTWNPSEVKIGADAVLSLWVEGLPENRDHRNLHIRLGSHAIEADFIAPWEPGKPAQINLRPPEELTPGTYPLTVAIGGVVSEAVSITCR